jgi:tyrosine-protein phosphatase non-receptor type 9
MLFFIILRTVERGRLKCGQYWPEEEEDVEEYGNFTVITNGSENYEEYKLTSLILQNNSVISISIF